MESGSPTEEQRNEAALYSRALFLLAFGEEQFKRLEMSNEEREAVRALADAAMDRDKK